MDRWILLDHLNIMNECQETKLHFLKKVRKINGAHWNKSSN